MKILEGLFAWKQVDQVVATTTGIDHDSETIINKNKPVPCGLIRIDKKEGYRLSGEVEPDYNLISYSYQPNTEDNFATVSSYHLYKPDSYKRTDNPELIHFLVLDKPENCYSFDLINASTFTMGTEELLEMVDSDKESGFVPINESEITRLSSETDYEAIYREKEKYKRLLSYILYAKEHKETLFIYYEPKNYEVFKEDLFSALSFLPKDVANSISFITANAGKTRKFNIVGIPSIDPIDSGASSNDLYFVYPFEGSVPKEIMNDSLPMVRLFDSFKNVSLVRDFIRHMNKLNRHYNGLADYYNDVETSMILLDSPDFETTDEKLFFNNLIEYLKNINNNFDLVFNKMPQETVDDLLERITKVFKNYVTERMVNGLKPEVYFQVVDLLINLINGSDNNLLKKRFLECLYQYLFNFMPSVDFSLLSHLTIIKYVFENKHREFAEKDLCAYIYQRDKGNETIDRFDSVVTKGSTGLEIAKQFFRTYLKHILNGGYQLSTVKQIIILLLDATRTKFDNDEKVGIIFDNENYSLREKLSLFRDLSDKSSLTSDLIVYLREKNLLLDVIYELVDDSRPDEELIESLIDGYLEIGKAKNYSELSCLIIKLYNVKNDHLAFNIVKERIVGCHLEDSSGFDLDSITKISVFDASHGEKETLDRIYKLFSKKSDGFEKNIIDAIDAKRKQIEDLNDAKKHENELTEFRLKLVLRILCTLPEKTSRNLIRRNLQVRKHATDYGFDDVYSLHGEEYTNRLNALAYDFFTREFNNPQGGIVDKRREFSEQITRAQKDNRFNIRNITSVASALIISAIFGGAFFFISAALSSLSLTLLTHNSYFTTYLVLSVANGVASFLMTFANMYNRGRKPVYLFSILESVGFLLLSLGVFIFFAFLLGGI